MLLFPGAASIFHQAVSTVFLLLGVNYKTISFAVIARWKCIRIEVLSVKVTIPETSEKDGQLLFLGVKNTDHWT